MRHPIPSRQQQQHGRNVPIIYSVQSKVLASSCPCCGSSNTSELFDIGYNASLCGNCGDIFSFSRKSNVNTVRPIHTKAIRFTIMGGHGLVSTLHGWYDNHASAVVSYRHGSIGHCGEHRWDSIINWEYLSEQEQNRLGFP